MSTQVSKECDMMSNWHSTGSTGDMWPYQKMLFSKLRCWTDQLSVFAFRLCLLLRSVQIVLQDSQHEIRLHGLGETIRNHCGCRNPFQTVSSVLHRSHKLSWMAAWCPRRRRWSCPGLAGWVHDGRTTSGGPCLDTRSLFLPCPWPRAGGKNTLRKIRTATEQQAC